MRQQYSDKKLQVLISVFDKLDDENDETPLQTLCRVAGLSASQLKLHHRHASYFRECYGTYGEACDVLKKEALTELRKATIAALKRMKFRKGKEPSLQMIRHIAMQQPRSDWLELSSVSSTWAQKIRNIFREQKVSRKCMKNKRSKRFLNYIDWVAVHMRDHERISYALAKQKHIEIIGEIKSTRAWSNFSNRVRERTKLQYFEDKSLPKGDVRYFWTKN